MSYGVQIYYFKYSTFLKRATYFESTGDLIVELKKNDKEYKYCNVDIIKWRRFCSSEKEASNMFRNELKKNLIVELSEEEKEKNRLDNLENINKIIEQLGFGKNGKRK